MTRSPATWMVSPAFLRMNLKAATDAAAFQPTARLTGRKSTDRVYALVRALSPPFPGAHSYLDTRRITIVRASPVRDGPRYAGRIPGRVVGRSRANGYVDVLTGDGILRILEVIAGEDGEVIPASAVITSTRQTLGLQKL